MRPLTARSAKQPVGQGVQLRPGRADQAGANGGDDVLAGERGGLGGQPRHRPDPPQPVDGQAPRDRAQLAVLADQSGLASPVPLAG